MDRVEVPPEVCMPRGSVEGGPVGPGKAPNGQEGQSGSHRTAGVQSLHTSTAARQGEGQKRRPEVAAPVNPVRAKQGF